MSPEKKKEIVRNFYKEVDDANDKYFHFWKEHTLFHWDWWLSFGLTIIPWIIWLQLRQKETTARYMFSAFFIIIITSWLDFIGVVLGLWYYPSKILPTIPSYIPWDFCMFPVSMTIFMQFKPQISPFKKAIVYSSLVSFVGEPLFQLIGFYTMVHWKYIYSFPIYLIIYLCADWISKRKTF
ncbi:CBO0543 family protein [Bacillus sp. USDA818B3_A]|uniref:CBO0543 family protein n=1 Tax=Bacillus sp. USDA818B3_A TaxID=2698834 RepID=UPI00136D5C43|nr:CBO0543 family protein [Bacillus sp. USDA818B3_A]